MVVEEARKGFFFEKKKQKTFIHEDYRGTGQQERAKQ